MSVATQIGNVTITLASTNIESYLIKKLDIGFEVENRVGINIPLNVSVELYNGTGWADSILNYWNWNDQTLTITASSPYVTQSFKVNSKTVEYDDFEKTVKFEANSVFLLTHKYERLDDYNSGNFDRYLVQSFLTSAGATNQHFPSNDYTHSTYGAFDFGDIMFKEYASGVTYSDYTAEKKAAEFIGELCQIFGATYFQYNGRHFQYRTYYSWYGAPSTIALTIVDMQKFSNVSSQHIDGIKYEETNGSTFTVEQGDMDGDNVTSLNVLKELNLVADLDGASSNIDVKEIVITQTFSEIYNYYIRKDKDHYKIRCREFIPPGRRVSFGGLTFLVTKATNKIFDFYTEAEVIEV